MANGVDYLGWHFYLTDTGKVIHKLRGQNKKKLKRRMKGLQKGYAEERLKLADIKRSMATLADSLYSKIWNKAIVVTKGWKE